MPPELPNPELPNPNDSRANSRSLSEDLFDLEPTYFELPITFLDRRRAEELILNCDDDQADQLRLNALATLVVAQYCQYIGLVPDLDRSKLWNTTDFAAFNLSRGDDRQDVADLSLEDGRCLECRPYWSGESAVFIPRSTWQQRDGFLAIEISDDLQRAKLTGFLPTIEQEWIPVEQWSDLNAFFEALLSVPTEEVAPEAAPEVTLESAPLAAGVNRLDDWFAGVMRSGWSTLAEIQAQLGLQPQDMMPSFRSASPRQEKIANSPESRVEVQAKVLTFPASVAGLTEPPSEADRAATDRASNSGAPLQFRGSPDPSQTRHTNPDPNASQSPSQPNTEANEDQTLETIEVGFLVKTRRLSEGLREVRLQILPAANRNALPTALTVSLLDASGEVINQAKPKGNDSFGFRLAVELGERFGICIAFGQTQYTEYFVS